MDNTFTYMGMDRTQNFNLTKLKETSKENYKTSKSYNLFPYFKRNNNIFNTRNRDLLMNQQNCDPEMLKQELNSCKAIMHEQKSNFLSLKIKYGKLYNENLNNKNIISNTLGVPLDKVLTKNEVLDKIENVKLSKKKRALLEEALEGILLRMEIEEKKEKNLKLAKYAKELKDNSKVKKINDLVDDFMSQCEEQRKLLRMLKYLGEKSRIFEEQIVELEKNLSQEKTNKKELLQSRENKKEQYEILMEERNDLSHQSKTLHERIKRYAMTNREKADRIHQKDLLYKEKQVEFEAIEQYKSERDEKQKKLDGKIKVDEENKNFRRDQENELRKLNSECEELNNKMNGYNEEKPRLLKKAKEPKSEIENMKKLETTLKELKKEKEKQHQEHEENQKNLKKIEDTENEKNEQNKIVIDENNSKRNDMNQKIDELRNKLSELTEKNNINIKNIENNKAEYENLLLEEKKLKEDVEKNTIENEEEKKKKEDERKKESYSIKVRHQKELDSLKREKAKYSDENERFRRENEDNQKEIDDFDSQLQNFEEIEEQLKNAQIKLKGLKDNNA